MAATLHGLNDLERDGVRGRYAIGGAVGAIFYIEPFATFHPDVFVVLPTAGILPTMEPPDAARRQRGYEPEKECVMIEGVPVQFLPAFHPLTEEALAEARSISRGTAPTCVRRGSISRPSWCRPGEPKTASGWRCSWNRRSFTPPDWRRFLPSTAPLTDSANRHFPRTAGKRLHCQGNPAMHPGPGQFCRESRHPHPSAGDGCGPCQNAGPRPAAMDGRDKGWGGDESIAAFEFKS